MSQFISSFKCRGLLVWVTASTHLMIPLNDINILSYVAWHVNMCMLAACVSACSLWMTGRIFIFISCIAPCIHGGDSSPSPGKKSTPGNFFTSMCIRTTTTPTILGEWAPTVSDATQDLSRQGKSIPITFNKIQHPLSSPLHTCGVRVTCSQRWMFHIYISELATFEMIWVFNFVALYAMSRPLDASTHSKAHPLGLELPPPLGHNLKCDTSDPRYATYRICIHP